VTDSDPADRVRTLLLRGDNLLKNRRSKEKAREAYEEARKVAVEGKLEPPIRELIERRLEQLG
jgi:predicted negative regulator of RcsB-dependent stress response